MIYVIWQAFICLVLASSIICDASKNIITSEYVLLCSENHFDHQESSYGSNLKSLLSFLSKNATKNKGYYATNTTAIYGASKGETIYGMLECRGDTTPDDCASCVSSAIRQLPPKECPSDKGVMMWHDRCNIRYSNEEFLGHLEVEDVHIPLRNNETISTLDNDVKGFMKFVGDTLHYLGRQLRSISSNQPTSSSMEEGSKKYFKTNKTIVNDIVRLYTLVQCTPTLVPTDCGVCIGILINEMLVSCNGRRGGQVLNPSCYARFEVYPFYNDVVASSSLSQFPLAKGSDDKRRNKWLLASLLSTFPISATIWLLVLFAIRIFRRNKTKETCDDGGEERDTAEEDQQPPTTLASTSTGATNGNRLYRRHFKPHHTTTTILLPTPTSTTQPLPKLTITIEKHHRHLPFPSIQPPKSDLHQHNHPLATLTSTRTTPNRDTIHSNQTASSLISNSLTKCNPLAPLIETLSPNLNHLTNLRHQRKKNPDLRSAIGSPYLHSSSSPVLRSSSSPVLLSSSSFHSRLWHWFDEIMVVIDSRRCRDFGVGWWFSKPTMMISALWWLFRG